jgi:FkbM family methyltransferase
MRGESADFTGSGNPARTPELPALTLPESTMLARAKDLVCVRPLVPYPGWRFDVDWNNPDLSFQLRRQLWSAFRGQPSPTPFEMTWYDGLRVNVYLGNDLSKQLFIAGCYEPNEMAFLDTMLAPGMVFVDAGANEGLFTLLASRRVGKSGQVWSIEPSAREFGRLQGNVELNHLDNVRMVRKALAEFDGETELLVAQSEHAGQNTLGLFLYAEIQTAGKERVAVQTLDSLIEEHSLDRVDIVKLDVEGAEGRVLNGAHKLLSRMRPVLLLECNEAALGHQGSSTNAMLALLRNYDYRFFDFGDATSMIAAPAGTPIPETASGPYAVNTAAPPATPRLQRLASALGIRK